MIKPAFNNGNPYLPTISVETKINREEAVVQGRPVYFAQGSCAGDSSYIWRYTSTHYCVICHRRTNARRQDRVDEVGAKARGINPEIRRRIEARRDLQIMVDDTYNM